MRHAEKKKEKDKIAIALMLCFCVIALTSIFTIKSSITKINASGSDLPVSDKVPVKKPDTSQTEQIQKEKTSGKNTEDVPASVPTIDSRKDETPDGSSVPPGPAAGTRFRFPVNAPGAFLTTPFSINALVYSVTLDQYMTHSGVDIEAPADSQVLAIADGTVTAVYTDDRYGNSVEIIHTPQFTAIYSNLSDAAMVEIGDTVTAGQIIGGVGSSGLFESLEAAHLHLELLKDGTYVNPMDYIG